LFNRKPPHAEHVEDADMIDLLLDADEATRRQLVAQAIQSGALTSREADDLMAQTARLQRAAGPRSEPQPEPRPRAAWGIDYP
jgi:hypothetical protein